MINHIVLFKFKPGTSPEQIETIFQLVGTLPHKIPGILRYTWGPNTSNEGRTRGYTHGFVMAFESKEAVETYVPHPEHGKVVEEILKVADDILVFDYELAEGVH